MRCMNCGQDVPGDMKYCPKCGAFMYKVDDRSETSDYGVYAGTDKKGASYLYSTNVNNIKKQPRFNEANIDDKNETTYFNEAIEEDNKNHMNSIPAGVLNFKNEIQVIRKIKQIVVLSITAIFIIGISIISLLASKRNDSDLQAQDKSQENSEVYDIDSNQEELAKTDKERLAEIKEEYADDNREKESVGEDIEVVEPDEAEDEHFEYYEQDYAYEEDAEIQAEVEEQVVAEPAIKSGDYEINLNYVMGNHEFDMFYENEDEEFDAYEYINFFFDFEYKYDSSKKLDIIGDQIKVYVDGKEGDFILEEYYLSRPGEDGDAESVYVPQVMAMKGWKKITLTINDDRYWTVKPEDVLYATVTNITGEY